MFTPGQLAIYSQPISSAPPTYKLKVWDGSNWISPVKVWDGSNWINVKFWDGSAWQT